MCVFVLLFAYCMANAVPCFVGKIPCDKRGRMATQVERSEITWMKQDRAHSGTFIQSQLFSRLRSIIWFLFHIGI